MVELSQVPQPIQDGIWQTQVRSASEVLYNGIEWDCNGNDTVWVILGDSCNRWNVYKHKSENLTIALRAPCGVKRDKYNDNDKNEYTRLNDQFLRLVTFETWKLWWGHSSCPAKVFSLKNGDIFETPFQSNLVEYVHYSPVIQKVTLIWKILQNTTILLFIHCRHCCRCVFYFLPSGRPFQSLMMRQNLNTMLPGLAWNCAFPSQLDTTQQNLVTWIAWHCAG